MENTGRVPTTVFQQDSLSSPTPTDSGEYSSSAPFVLRVRELLQQCSHLRAENEALLQLLSPSGGEHPASTDSIPSTDTVDEAPLSPPQRIIRDQKIRIRDLIQENIELRARSRQANGPIASADHNETATSASADPAYFAHIKTLRQNLSSTERQLADKTAFASALEKTLQTKEEMLTQQEHLYRAKSKARKDEIASLVAQLDTQKEVIRQLNEQQTHQDHSHVNGEQDTQMATTQSQQASDVAVLEDQVHALMAQLEASKQSAAQVRSEADSREEQYKAIVERERDDAKQLLDRCTKAEEQVVALQTSRANENQQASDVAVLEDQVHALMAQLEASKQSAAQVRSEADSREEQYKAIVERERDDAKQLLDRCTKAEEQVVALQTSRANENQQASAVAVLEDQVHALMAQLEASKQSAAQVRSEADSREEQYKAIVERERDDAKQLLDRCTKAEEQVVALQTSRANENQQASDVAVLEDQVHALMAQLEASKQSAAQVRSEADSREEQYKAIVERERDDAKQLLDRCTKAEEQVVALQTSRANENQQASDVAVLEDQVHALMAQLEASKQSAAQVRSEADSREEQYKAIVERERDDAKQLLDRCTKAEEQVVALQTSRANENQQASAVAVLEDQVHALMAQLEASKQSAAQVRSEADSREEQYKAIVERERDDAKQLLDRCTKAEEQVVALQTSRANENQQASDVTVLEDQVHALMAQLEASKQSAVQLRSEADSREEQYKAIVERCEVAEKQAQQFVEVYSEVGGETPANGCCWWRQRSIVKPLVCRSPEICAADLPYPEHFWKWGFDVIGCAKQVPSVLQSCAKEVAVRWALFSTEEQLHCWLTVASMAETNYEKHPYHNALHGADVLQGVASLLTSCPELLQHMTVIEKRAVAYAAMMHDVRHPGRSNHFLREIVDPVFLEYNGRNALEQMHSATAMKFLANPSADFTAADMDRVENLRFHTIVCSLILHTDMALHASSMERWAQRTGAGSYNWSAEEDRLEALSLLLHAADIGAQSKGVEVATKWLGVVEEMHQQGDDESRRGLPVGIGNRRGQPIAADQLFFIETFVVPIFAVVGELFPGVTTPMENLRKIHAHYAADLGEVSRAFPASTSQREVYEAEQAKAANIVAKADWMEKSADKMKEVSNTLAQKQRELQQREQALEEEEKRIEQLRRTTLQAQPAAPANEAGLSALAVREQRLAAKEAELEEQRRFVEEREKVAAALSEQVAAIAEEVTRERRNLRAAQEAKGATALRAEPLLRSGAAAVDLPQSSARASASNDDVAQRIEQVVQLLSRGIGNALLL